MEATVGADPRHAGGASAFAPQSPMVMSPSPAPSTPAAAFPPVVLLPRKPPRRRRRSSLSLSSSCWGGAGASSGGAAPHRARVGGALSSRTGVPSFRRYRTRARERRCAVLATAHVSSDAAAAASVVRAALCQEDLSDDDDETINAGTVKVGGGRRRVSITGAMSEAELFRGMNLNDDDTAGDGLATSSSPISMTLGAMASVPEGMSPPSIRRVSGD